MPGGRGGRRKGTPGQAYTNRTDLALDYSEPDATNTPASGGIPPAAAGGGAAPTPIYPDSIPKLDDPSARPDEPLMTPPKGPRPSDPIMDDIYRAYHLNPTPQLAAVIRYQIARSGNR